MTTIVNVKLAGRGYDILVGSGLLADAGAQIFRRVGARKLVILTDATVAGLHLEALRNSLIAVGYDAAVVEVPAGEASKDLYRFPELAERILDLGLERGAMLVALGGGVVGDLAGFLAATLLRGIDFIQIPTTLLAQIDSSVGGKTGVNTRQGKNLIGAFHQPRLVLADLSVLGTLPRRELLAGYAEMIKYGVLGDAAFFDLLETQGDRILALDPAALESAIAHCCRMKAEIVAEDEREAGRRALLNLGHTFGHALEAETGFGAALLHGESVAIGMAMAADLSFRLGRCSQGDAGRIIDLVASSGLPTDIRALPGAPFAIDRLIAHMGHDKKVAEGKITFILLDAIGRSTTMRDVPLQFIRDTLASFGAI